MRGPFFELTAWLYYLCFLLLAALLLLIALRRRPHPRRYKQRKRRRPTRPDSNHQHQRRLRRAFFALSLALLLWQLTLFAETRTASFNRAALAGTAQLCRDGFRALFRLAFCAIA